MEVEQRAEGMGAHRTEIDQVHVPSDSDRPAVEGRSHDDRGHQPGGDHRCGEQHDIGDQPRIGGADESVAPRGRRARHLLRRHHLCHGPPVGPPVRVLHPRASWPPPWSARLGR